MKRIILNASFVLIVIFSLSFIVSCDSTIHYRGNNVELHVIATNSLLGVRGSENDDVYVLEQDQHGRVMFAFQGRSTNTKGVVLAILISQKTTKTHSYFYEDINYYLVELPDRSKVDGSLITQHFTNAQINDLKFQNDWGKEMDDEQLFEVEIVNLKKDTVSETDKREAFSKVSNDFNGNYTTLLTTDQYGKSLYYMRGNRYDENTDQYVFTESYLFMFNKDGTVDSRVGIEELTDLWNYREQLQFFKEKNNWNE